MIVLGRGVVEWIAKRTNEFGGFGNLGFSQDHTRDCRFVIETERRKVTLGQRKLDVCRIIATW